MENRIKRLRFDAGLTQTQLAEAAGISQQQLQRIEAGVQEPRLCVAMKIAEGLDADLDVVFPPVKKAARIARTARKIGKEPDGTVLNETLAKAGMELDVFGRLFRCRLRNYPEAFDLPISEADYKGLRDGRLGWADAPPPAFLNFGSGGYTVLLNTTCLTYWEYACDVPAGFRLVDGRPQWDRQAPEEPGEANREVQVYMADGSTFTLEGEPDDREWHGGEELDEEAMEQVRMQYFCFEVELAGDAARGPDDMGVVSLPGVIEDNIFLNLRDVAMIKVPLWLTSPALQDAERDIDCGEGDEDEGDDREGVALKLVPAGDGK